jgi:hypothetical protein
MPGGGGSVTELIIKRRNGKDWIKQVDVQFNLEERDMGKGCKEFEGRF